MEREDEQQVKPDVQDGREQQEEQRRCRVAHAAQERADEVIKKLRADTGEDDHAVGVRRVIDRGAVRRDVYPREHRVQKRKRERGEDDGQHGGEHKLRRK